MANFYEDNEDLQFYVERGIDWEPIIRLTEYDWRSEDGFRNVEEALDVYTDVLRLVGEFAAEEIAPRVEELDANKPKLVDGEVVYCDAHKQIFEQVKELELHGMCVPRELGGMNMPLLTYMVLLELWSRADVSVTAHHGFHGGMAMAALMYSVFEGSTETDTDNPKITKTRFADVIAEIISGETWGSMDITEPSAGSDMAKLRCKGEQDEDGNWFVTGEKIFITSGDGKYHFVIARTEKTADEDDPFAGLAGMSMFLVPAWTTDKKGKRKRLATIEKLEDKLGHNGSATCAIHFDRTPAHLLGKRGEGFRQMLLLMNNARIGVGFESLGLCEAAYRSAKKYASERPSMGKTIDKHEMIADYLDEMETDILAIRCLAMHAGQYEETSQKLRLMLRFWTPEVGGNKAELKGELKRLSRRSRHLTPLLKYYASEKAVEMARQCVQIHGGAGYMVEFGAEKLLRDAMVFPIYEGTSQIQALMAMKDNLLDVVKRPRNFMRRTAQARWKAVSARDPLERRVAKLQSLKYSTLQFLMSRLAGAKVRELRHHPMSEWSGVMTGWDPKKDFALAMLHAERLTRILADVAICEELLSQVQKFPERRWILERFLERAEPRCRNQNDIITTTGLRLLGELHGTATEEPPAAQAQAQAAK